MVDKGEKLLCLHYARRGSLCDLCPVSRGMVNSIGICSQYASVIIDYMIYRGTSHLAFNVSLHKLFLSLDLSLWTNRLVRYFIQYD